MPNMRITSLALKLLKRFAKAGRRPMTKELERILIAEDRLQRPAPTKSEDKTDAAQATA